MGKHLYDLGVAMSFKQDTKRINHKAKKTIKSQESKTIKSS